MRGVKGQMLVMRKYPKFMLCVLMWMFVHLPSALATELVMQNTPDGGVQPRLVADDQGQIHLLYFKKRLARRDAREGNLYYRQFNIAEQRFGNPVKVSSKAFAMQTFAIARAGIAVDGDGRIHVIWYGPREGQFLYSRSNEDRSAFEPQQAMVHEFGEGIDAGADIAASGNKVAILWGAGDLSREYERTVFTRLSTDHGESFGQETRIGNPDLGACACCSLAGEFDTSGSLQVAYRSAINGIGRHMQLLTLNMEGNDISSATYGAVNSLQEWEASFCPLSTNDFATDSKSDNWLVFETESRIVQLNFSAQSQPTLVGEPFSETRQRNPAMAINERAEKVIVWAEAISHARGGRLNLKLFNSEGESEAFELTEEITIPDYSFPAAVTMPDGNFLVLF